MVKTAIAPQPKLEVKSKKVGTTEPKKSMPTASKVELRAKIRMRTTLIGKLTVEQRVKAIGRQIQKDYGVAVVPKRGKSPNPYEMSADDAAKVMQKAGILTKAGNLSPSYK
jgi:hypothetical protein